MSRLDRLRNEARDLFEMVLVPGLAAVLPWVGSPGTELEFAL